MSVKTHGLSTTKLSILQFLLDAKRADSPFVTLYQFRRVTVWELGKAGLIFSSRGKDGIRYAITYSGEKALKIGKLPIFRYFWEGRGYSTIKAMAQGEGMTYNQARYRARNNFRSNNDMLMFSPVEINGVIYENIKDAEQKLNRSTELIRDAIRREKQRKKSAKKYARVSVYQKQLRFQKQFERLGIRVKV